MESDCQWLTIDDVAKRVGIAKGGLYLNTHARRNSPCNSWRIGKSEVPPPCNLAETDQVDGILDRLCTIVIRGVSENAAAFPCCLYISLVPMTGSEAGRRWFSNTT